MNQVLYLISGTTEPKKSQITLHSSLPLLPRKRGEEGEESKERKRVAGEGKRGELTPKFPNSSQSQTALSEYSS